MDCVMRHCAAFLGERKVKVAQQRNKHAKCSRLLGVFSTSLAEPGQGPGLGGGVVLQLESSSGLMHVISIAWAGPRQLS